MQRPSESDPFVTTGLIALPPFDAEATNRWDGFNFDDNLESGTFYLPDVKKEELPLLQPNTFKLPALEADLESIDASSTSAYDTAEDVAPTKEAGAESEANYEDVWVLPDVKDAPRTSKLNTWYHFRDETYKEPAHQYVSEAGAAIFDVILVRESADEQIKIAPSDAHLDALFELALGRSSQYMTWDEQHQEFVPTVTKLTISGHSPELIDDLRSALAAMGRTMRLASGVDVHSSKATPGKLAFYSATNSILAALQCFVQQRRSRVASPVQLQNLLEIPRQFVGCVDRLLEVVQQSTDDTLLVKDVLRATQSMVTRLPQCQLLFTMPLSAIAGPVLATLKADLDTSAIAEDDAEQATSSFRLLPDDLRQLARESQSSKALMSAMKTTSVHLEARSLLNQIDLGLRFSWSELAEVQQEIDLAETHLRIAQPPVQQASPGMFLESHHETATLHFESIEFDKITRLPFHAGQERVEAAIASCMAEEVLSNTAFPVPYDQVIELSLAPVISAQHRAASFAALQALFQEGGLLTHLSLLKDFQLLGNGPFATRISIALFDSSQASGEGRRRDGNLTGLRLGSRDIWPPTSSELRLVLMGILREHLPNNGDQQFEDNISFSLRDLPEEALERCRDVNSIYALDFLRLHYRPPNPLLEAMITPRILDKYDRVFQYLLRLMRVQHVAQQLLRDISSRAPVRINGLEHRFRISMQHATSTLADYSNNTALTCSWLAFEQMLATVRSRIDANDYEGTLKSGRSLTYLRDLLEEALDSMLRALLLKEKQSKTRKMIEELFSIVLTYAASIRQTTATTPAENAGSAGETIKRHFDDFKKCVHGLKEALQKEDGLPQHLLLRLSM